MRKLAFWQRTIPTFMFLSPFGEEETPSEVVKRKRKVRNKMVRLARRKNRRSK